VFFVTDPDRTQDPFAVATRLPRGTGVIFRGFGRSDAEAEALALSQLARRRGLVLLIGQDDVLAARVGAAGVHLPERDLWRGRLIRRRHPAWLITGAAHSPMALATACRVGLDVALISTVFASHSPSATQPLGPVRLAAMVRGGGVAVAALGGVNGRTAKRLIGTGVTGFAAVEGVSLE
jgi:thiamine-phosphate pyrophosphorylase